MLVSKCATNGKKAVYLSNGSTKSFSPWVWYELVVYLGNNFTSVLLSGGIWIAFLLPVGMSAVWCILR